MHFAASCHQPAVGLGGTPLYFWETLAAFVFVYLLYPAILAKPGYGAMGPLFAGVALFAVVSTGTASEEEDLQAGAMPTLPFQQNAHFALLNAMYTLLPE